RFASWCPFLVSCYTTSLMDHLYTKADMKIITKGELLKDERYKLIKEAVRSRFQLDDATMNIEWSALHESVLHKQRNSQKKQP
ncbi:unnamed protein product, partial [Didymodactylos carnosus]